MNASNAGILFANTMDRFSPDCIHLMDRVPNTIISNGYFVRILYTLPHATINGIYIVLDIPFMRINMRYGNMRATCTFSPNDVPAKWLQLESEILDKLRFTPGYDGMKRPEGEKVPILKLTHQLQTGLLKLNHTIGHNVECRVVVNISGIWESATHYGLMYKCNLCAVDV